jgi:hypothetical protein
MTCHDKFLRTRRIRLIMPLTWGFDGTACRTRTDDLRITKNVGHSPMSLSPALPAHRSAHNEPSDLHICQVGFHDRYHEGAGVRSLVR